LGAAAWKRAGTRVRRGVEFEGSWVLGMRYQAVGSKGTPTGEMLKEIRIDIGRI